MATKILPLEQRIFKTAKLQGPRIPYSHLRPETYKNWEQTSLDAAVVAVEVDGVSIRRAAELYNIPKSTLYDHVSGRVARYAKPGPKPYLSMKEEEELVNFLLKCARIGYPHTRQQVIGIVQEILNKKSSEPIVVTNGWWERFINRHPNLSLRTPAPLSFIRAMATDKECLERYFDLLQSTLEENNILDKAACIFNCDETGFPLCAKGGKVLCEVGEKNPYHLTANTKNQVTVLACTSAAGYALPPFVCFAQKTLNIKLTEGEVPGTVYGLGSNGWMNSDLFTDWFKGHFLHYAPACRPLLLLLDGHKSHYCPEFICQAAAEGVIVFTLPPNTTHLCQPLDKGPFSPIKTCWKKVVQDFTVRTRRAVTRYDFSALFAEVWSKSMTLKNIAAGFKTTGIYPFNRKAVIQEENFTEFNPEELSLSTGIRFIPLYSPSHVSTISVTTPNHSHSCYDSSILEDISSLETETLQETTSLSMSDNDLASDLMIPETPVRSTLGELTSSSYNLKEKVDACFLPVKRGRVVTKFISTPCPPSKLPVKNIKSCGKVLTSKDQLKIIEEKAKKKEEEEHKKENRKLQREEAKKVREEAKKIREEAKQKKKIQKQLQEEEKENRVQKKQSTRKVRKEFTEEEVVLFTRRFENGYDLFDSRYEEWLQLQNDTDTQMPIEKTIQRENVKRMCGKKIDKEIENDVEGLKKRTTRKGARKEFTEEEVALFTRRFENGYDLFDSRYEEWLQLQNDTDTQMPKKTIQRENVKRMCGKKIDKEIENDIHVKGLKKRPTRKDKNCMCKYTTVCLSLLIFCYMYQVRTDIHSDGIPIKKPSQCSNGTCSHQKAVNWVECTCGAWLHCICAGISVSVSRRKEFKLKCCGNH